MVVLIGVLLVLCSAAVLTLPFIRRWRRGYVVPSPDVLEEARRRREAVYQEILTLRLDYETGNVPEREYKSRLHGYRLRAAAALRDEKLLAEQVAELDQKLEVEIRQARGRDKTRQQRAVCLRCGALLSAALEVCPHCGEARPVVTTTTPKAEIQ